MTQEAIQIRTTPPLSGADMVAQANAALSTIASDFAGDNDPAALAGPYMTWADTANQVLKRRNAAGTAWTVVGNLSPIASQADVDAGTNDDKFATPLKLRNGFSVNLAGNGHIKLPSWLGGFQICWGNPTTTPTGGIAISFSRAFLISPYTVLATPNAAGIFAISMTASASATVGTFFMANSSGGGVGSAAFFYVAFGRG